MAGKYSIGSLNVKGQAMVGDNNQMHVNLAALNVADQATVEAALAQISGSLEGAAQQGNAPLSNEQRAQIQQAVHDVIDELKKPRESQNGGFLKRCLDNVMKVAAALPPVVNAAMLLKGALGL